MEDKKVYCFDIDGTILTLVPDGNYDEALPIPGRVEHLRSLKEKGHIVKLFTARGSKSGIDWRGITEAQIAQFGIPCDELILGKPHADIYVDDKACHPSDYEWRVTAPGSTRPQYPSNRGGNF